MHKKAVILAAGWGTRLRPLTFGRPKPAIRLVQETLIEHNLRQLSGLVKEAIIVVGYKEEIIKEIVGERFAGIKITYVNQEKQLGTGHAAKEALPSLGEEFVILNGDDLYLREDIERCLKKNPSILVKEVKDPRGYGQVSVEKGRVKEIVEKPPVPVSNLINVGCYHVSKSFFKEEIEKSSRGEYEIIDYLKKYIEEGGEMSYVSARDWRAVTYPWNILDATEDVLEREKEKRKGTIEKGAFVEGKVIMEEGSVIKKGSIVEGTVYIGKDTVIGPGAYVRGNTAIHDNCLIGRGVEVKNSVIFSGTKVPHYGFVGDSVIGENCNIGTGVVLINFLFGGDTVQVKVKDKFVSTGREEMGAVIGNNVKIGPNVSVMPGVTIGDDTTIYPHTLVRENVEKDTKNKGA